MNLEGCTVLIIEDEALISLEMESMLRGAGCRVVGPFASMTKASEAIEHQLLDAALLDINLGHEMTFPLADLLCARGVPFIWVTGHSRDILPARHRDRPIVSKPYGVDTLLEAVSKVIARCRPASDVTRAQASPQ